MRLDHLDASELRILLEPAQIRTEAKAFGLVEAA